MNLIEGYDAALSHSSHIMMMIMPTTAKKGKKYMQNTLTYTNTHTHTHESDSFTISTKYTSNVRMVTRRMNLVVVILAFFSVSLLLWAKLIHSLFRSIWQMVYNQHEKHFLGSAEWHIILHLATPHTCVTTVNIRHKHTK